MRAAGAPGHAGKSQGLAGSNGLFGCDIILVEVTDHADQPVAVVDENRLAVEEVITHAEYYPMGHRPHGGAARYGDVQPGVGRAGFAVEDTVQAEAAGNSSADRLGEVGVGIVTGFGGPPVTLERLNLVDFLERSRLSDSERVTCCCP